jgi:hypothetical protein
MNVVGTLPILKQSDIKKTGKITARIHPLVEHLTFLLSAIDEKINIREQYLFFRGRTLGTSFIPFLGLLPADLL